MIVIDASRTIVSWRAARALDSAALESNALHFFSDLLGSAAVLVGLVLVRAGYPSADSIAALFVAVLVLAAAARLMRTNVDVLMDRVPVEAEAAARAAIAGITPVVDLKRLRMREAGGRQFADVVIGVPLGRRRRAGPRSRGQRRGGRAGGAAAKRRRRARRAGGDGGHPRARAGRSAQRPARARGAQHQRARRRRAHRGVAAPEAARRALARGCARDRRGGRARDPSAVPGVEAVQTHLEPLAEDEHGRPAANVDADAGVVRRIVREALGREPRELRFLQTNEGLVAFVTLGLDPTGSLADAHTQASEVEARIRSARPEIADVIVHTEP